MDGELFLETLQHVQRRTCCSPHNKILLLLDNAVCHMNIYAAEYAFENGIVIDTLPPHTAAKLQPLTECLWTIQVSHATPTELFPSDAPNKLVTEHSLAKLACQAWIKACTPANIVSGFKATGINYGPMIDTFSQMRHLLGQRLRTFHRRRQL